MELPKSNRDLLPGTLSAGDTLKLLWLNWCISFGALSLLLILSLFIKPILLPVIAFAEAAWVHYYKMPKSADTAEGRLAGPLLSICVKNLVISGILMLVINALCTPWLIGRVLVLEMYNDEIPFITCLVIFPVQVVLSVWWLLFHRPSLRPGSPSPNPMRALVPRESAYQVRILMILSFVMSAVECWYYVTRYINSDFNNPDRFFFVFMPVGIYLLSIFFMGGRYTTLSTLVSAVQNIPVSSLKTLVRYLVFSDNDVLVRPDINGLYDTPVETMLPSDEKPSDEELRKMFSKFAETEDYTLRYLFTSDPVFQGAAENGPLWVRHYAVLLGKDVKRGSLSCQNAGDRWAGLYDIQRLAAKGELSPTLARELVRIYTITMAWKSYDREGRRLYPIRNYRPTFRFRDLAKWNVDYDDTSWLEVARFNEDKPLFRIRRFLRNLRGRQAVETEE